MSDAQSEFKADLVLKNATVWSVDSDLARAETSGRCVLSESMLEADIRQIPDAQTVAELP
jgi:hypothetical protein